MQCPIGMKFSARKSWIYSQTMDSQCSALETHPSYVLPVWKKCLPLSYFFLHHVHDDAHKKERRASEWVSEGDWNLHPSCQLICCCCPFSQKPDGWIDRSIGHQSVSAVRSSELLSFLLCPAPKERSRKNPRIICLSWTHHPNPSGRGSIGH